MPLLKNKFQPFFPDPKAPASFPCGDAYCNLVAAGDIIHQQWYQTPCAGNIVVDSTFDESNLGAELITNGTPVCPIGAEWTLTGNWSCATDTFVHSGLGQDEITQTVAITPGSFYQLTFDMVTYVTGDVSVYLGSVGVLAAFGSLGSQAVVLQAGSSNSDIVFQSSLGFNGSIAFISLKEITFDDWVPESGWLLENEQACHVATGTVDLLYNGTSDYITDTDYYVVTVTVAGYVSGDLTVYIDDGTGTTQTDQQTAITANGDYTFYITASQDGVIGFEASADFIGCISSPSVKRLRNDYTFELINSAGDSVDISAYATYTDQYIDINVDMASLLETDVIQDYGCYTIYVYDSCLISGDNILTDGNFAEQTFEFWHPNMSLYQYNFDGNGIEFVFEPLEGPNLVSNGDFAGGTTDWTGFGADWTIVGGKARHTVGNTTPLVQSITLAAYPALPDVYAQWWQIEITNWTAGTVVINIGGTNSVAYGNNDVITQGMVLQVGGAQNLTITPSSNFDGDIDEIKVHETINGWVNNPQIAHVATPELVDGNYNVDFDIVSNTWDGQIGVSTQLDYNNGIFIDRLVGPVSNSIIPYVQSLQRLRLSGVFTHPVYGYFKVGRIAIDNVELYPIEPFEATYTSECFNFQETHPNTKLITGWCDQDTLGSTPTDNIAFDTTGYILQLRVRVRSINPVLPTSGNNAFFSDGSSAVKYAQIEKYWQLQTDYLSDAAHTALAAIIRCDHFLVGDTGTDDTEYLATMEDYAPSWRADGGYDLASIIINIRTKEQGMNFMRHT